MTFGSKKIEGVGASDFGYPSEREVLVAGGLMPSSISEIEVFDEAGSVGSPSLTAKRIEDGDTSQIVIEDCRGQFMIIRTYVLNPATSKFEFSTEEKTDTPSPRREVPMPIGLELELSKLIIKNQKIYSSPFIQINNLPVLNGYSFIESKIKPDLLEINKISDFENYIFGSESLKLNEFKINFPKDLISKKEIYQINELESKYK